MIERALKLRAKTYDGTIDLEATYLWLDRVSEINTVMGCSDEQKVLFSGFLMATRAKDWWEAIKMRHPTGVTWDKFRQTFTDSFTRVIYRMFPLRAGRSLYPRLSTASSCRDL